MIKPLIKRSKITQRNHYSQEIGRLYAKNAELLEKLKRLGDEVGQKLKFAPKKQEPKKRSEIREMELSSEISSLEKTEHVMKVELEYLKTKINIDASGERIMKLEKRHKASLQRNDQLQKLISKKTRDIKKTLKRSARSDEHISINKQNQTNAIYIDITLAVGIETDSADNARKRKN